MEIRESKSGDVVILSVSGSIDTITAPTLTVQIKYNIDKGHNKLVADLKDVDYTSSAGLRVLLAAVKETRALNGDLRLAEIQPNVHKVLTLSGFVNIMKTFNDVESAVRSFSE
jgi:anti-sigma B factor antagonist